MGKISLDLTKCSIRPKGVGLFLMKAQVEGMGGISVESTVDVGTKFKIIF
jgi:chemotaxis protein histidine kinase CheA